MIMPRNQIGCCRCAALCLVFPPPSLNTRPVTQILTLENYHTMKCIQTAHCKQYLCINCRLILETDHWLMIYCVRMTIDSRNVRFSEKNQYDDGCCCTANNHCHVSRVTCLTVPSSVDSASDGFLF